SLGIRRLQSVRACSAVNQFPRRTPSLLAPLTRRIQASSGFRSPESAASDAKRRMAASRTLIVPGANERLSRWIRYRVTTVLLKDKRGSEQYQLMNSLMEC